MIDGIHFEERVALVALGFDAQGKKHVLGSGRAAPRRPRLRFLSYIRN
jgi:hypothetical protein